MVETSELGVGVVWFGGLAPLVAQADDLIDFFEIEPATTSLPADESGELGRNRWVPIVPKGKSAVVHGVSCPVGGTIAPSPNELTRLATAADELGSPWISEHLSIDRLTQPDGQTSATGFFLPPAQTPATVDLAVRRLRHLGEVTGRPVAFETGVNYFAPQEGHMTDGEFFAAIAEQADCLILVDLHNLWCNENNGRQPVSEVIDSLPLDRVVEIHLAGGQHRDGYLLDAHSGLVDGALIDVAATVIARLPALRALTFELVPDYVEKAGIGPGSYRRQLEELHRLWELRGSACRSRALAETGLGRRRPNGRPSTGEPRSTPQHWEGLVAAALRGEQGPLQSDPGTALYRHLVETVRSGAVVTAMPLTFRLMVASLGIERAEAELARYQTAVSPSAWAVDEMAGFAEHVRNSVPVPHLDEVAGFELAAYEAELTGKEQTIAFTCEPQSLLDALRSGRQPPTNRPAGLYDVTVVP